MIADSGKENIMRKRIIGREPGAETARTAAWLDLATLAVVELTSEDPDHPFEAALQGADTGWRAATLGPQTIRLVFDAPQPIRRIRLVFREMAQQRTQEFVLRWSGVDGHSAEVVRQQYTFNPPGEEIEDYRVELNGVTELILEITPDISGSPVHAGLAGFQVG
jgi:hypothetical protein